MDFIQPSLDGYTAEKIRKVELGRLKAAPVLFHSGYLTIDRVSAAGDGVNKDKEKLYYFRLPNTEVEKSYKPYCLETVFLQNTEFESFGPVFLQALNEKDAFAVAKILGDLLSTVTSRQHVPLESFYHAVIQSALTAVGLEVKGEPAGAKGQADMSIRLDDGRWAVVEVKYAPWREAHSEADKEKELTKALNSALKAIKDKDYAGPFRLKSKELIGLGVAVYGRDDLRAGFVEESDLMRRPR
jgi:hypothetical protein